jgi:MerR family transcriptional regulator, light-induced transcriptional regulator
MASYSISDLEKLSGIKAHTLRIWEKRYQLLIPERSETNIRTYGTSQLTLLLNISLLKDHGVKISEIAKYSLKEIEEKVLAISEQKLSYPDQVQALTIAMLELNEDKFEEILTENIAEFGFENTMLFIIYPFLIKIGILWITGSVGPAQEHFMSSLIRQKLIVAIDSLQKRLAANHKTIVLFLPDGEYHEIGLLFANYLFKSKGHKTVYLGQSLPTEDLYYVVDLYKADFVFTAITSSPNSDKIQCYIDTMAEKLGNTSAFITGYQALNNDLKLPKNVTIVSDIDELKKIIGWIG